MTHRPPAASPAPAVLVDTATEAAPDDDTPTAASRADQQRAAARSRTLVTGIASSLGGKAVGLVAPLLITPVAFNDLGAERYGLWMAVTSLTGMALFADFGLGNGLLTRLARLHAAGDRQAAAREIASAYAMLGALAVGLLAVLVATARAVPWPTLLNVTDPAVARDTRAVVLLCFGAFLVNIPLGLIQRVQYAHQQVAQSNLWQAGGSLVSVGLVFAAVAADAGPVLVVGAAVLAVPVVSLGNSICYFGWQNRLLRPRRRDVRVAVARGLLRLGVRFFVLSVLSSMALNVDPFLVGRLLGLEASANYAVVLRLFSLLALFVTLVNMPLWPANGEALARGDVSWVRRNTRRMIVLSVAAVAVPAGGLVLWGNDILQSWVRSPELPPTPVAVFAALATWSVLVASASPMFMVQNSIGLLRPQFAGWTAFLVFSVVLKITVARRLGLAGIASVGAASYALTVLPAALFGYRRTLSVVAARGGPRSGG
ncbi:lipopolysaccharide biosynthesis protein [Micromonospora sp. NPDC047074]|uniref:lipopolysaccharide biosynthesis protein n=1 Tax=Micromonospora sp. NPDC047074 TaxID=3154339 RepID=UPI0033CEE033